MEDPNTLPWTSDRQWTLPYLSFRVQSWCQSWKFGFGMYSTAMLTFSQRLWCQRLLLNVIQEQFTETLSTSSTFICLLFCRRRNLVIAAFSMIWHFPCILKKRIEFQLWQNFLTAKKNLFNVRSKTLSTSSTFVCLLFCRWRNLVIATFSLIWHFPCILKKKHIKYQHCKLLDWQK